MIEQISPEEARKIAGQARTLQERLEGPPNEPGDDPPFDPDELFADWIDKFPNREMFNKRLKYEDLSETAVYEQLAATHWPTNEPIPNWVDQLDSLINHVEKYQSSDQDPISVPDETPFVELLVAIVDYGCTQLPDEIWPQNAMSQMEEWLISRLNQICVRALYVEFKSFVEYHDPELAAADPNSITDPGTMRYEQFIDSMFDDGFRKFCIEYPVLARYLIQQIEYWTTLNASIWKRFQNDHVELNEKFDISGEVVAINPLADDVHAGGQAPVQISFESGSIIYKPRPIDGGILFYTILDKLSDYVEIPKFDQPRYISRDEYGWMETIKYSEPSDAAAVERYYKRAGMILCVSYALDLPDCQFENLIVNGDQPMIIDAETIFHPYISPVATSYTTEVETVSSKSVLRTALLPWVVGDINDEDNDLPKPFLAAGLGSSSDTAEVSEVSKPIVKAVNTDVMTVKGESPSVDRTMNTPSIDGTDQPPEQHIDEIIEGFQRTYETICDLHNDGRFSSEIFNSDLITEVENRMVYRSTDIYRSTLRVSVARDPLRDGARLSIEFERLAVPFFNGRIESDRYWELYEAERRSLRQRDVPRFTSQPDQTMIYHDGSPTGVDANMSGYDNCMERLNAMDTNDLQKQIWIIRRCFDTSTPNREAPSSIPTLTDEQLQREAIRYGDCTIDTAIETEAGRKWASVIGEGLPQICISPADNTLYDGRGGIGLTAAALYDQTGHDRFYEQAIKALDPVVNDQGESPTEFGGIKGTGSIVYTLSVAADLLNHPTYRDRAAEYACALTMEQLENDKIFDLVDGTAGMLLGLLAYYERYGGSTIRDRAIDCGERLLNGRTSINGYRVWRTGTDKPIPGIAHGVSGVAYALARLAVAVGNDQYATAAREALSYESTLYVPERSNYIIPTDSGENQYHDQWCHGRTGCALARLGIGTQLKDDELIADANEMLSATIAADFSSHDQLCCGNLGQAMALLEAARRTDRNKTDARAIVSRCLARREQIGTLSMPGHSEAIHNPTFFNGISGVAYTMLRLRDPDALPCVLLLE